MKNFILCSSLICNIFGFIMLKNSQAKEQALKKQIISSDQRAENSLLS